MLAAALVCLPFTLAANGQSVESKLSRKADFVPSDKSTLDRLVAIAKHYEIPMGIEWIGGVGSQELEVSKAALPAEPTVRDLLTAIVSRLADYQISVDNGVVHVVPPVAAARPDNLLNLLIEDFHVRNENLFGAQHDLRVAINITLNPDEYGRGYAGGYGHDPDHVFAKRRFSYRSDDASVRQILDGLIIANGNALWIAEPDPEATQTKSNLRPRKKGTPEVDRTGKYQWRFVPLNETR